jgi:hypothetical protein
VFVIKETRRRVTASDSRFVIAEFFVPEVVGPDIKQLRRQPVITIRPHVSARFLNRHFR